MPKGDYDRSRIVAERQRQLDIAVGKIKVPSAIQAERAENETDEQMDARIRERFRVMGKLTDMVIKGVSKALIIAGPPGLGKSYDTEKKLEAYDAANRRNPTDPSKYASVRGFARATGVYKKLYEKRQHGDIVEFDDADSIFQDLNTLNILKAACDTTELRTISYLAETSMVDENGDGLPSSFIFNGSVIFITNYDFDDEIAKESTLAPHLSALMSRAHYLDLGMKSRREYYVRVKQVAKQGLFDGRDMDNEMIEDVMAYMFEHMDDLRELSLRMAIKIADLRKIDPEDWRMMADVTCLKAI